MNLPPAFADLAGDISVSFEFFPPKSEKMEEQLWDAVTQLKPLDPSFVSVTYGAGGSTRERTHATVAAYPETHPDADCPQSDLDNLKRKLDAGATRAISQFFFSAETFFRFRDRCAAAGIDAPILPGILPVTNVAQARKFAAACGAEFPAWMDGLFEGLDEKPAARQLVAATVAAELCRRLYAGGVRDFHFYPLNRPELAYAICHMLGKRPVSENAA